MSAQVRIIASPGTWIEGAAVQQLEKTSTLPGMRLAVGLPDLHPGKGSPIGAAFAVEGMVYPTLIGSDIGCGVSLWRTGLSSRKIRHQAWVDNLRDLDDGWAGNARVFLEARGIEPSGYESSLGTIGGGNHFAELQAIESSTNPQELGDDAVYLCVHSGSRGFGGAVLGGYVDAFGAEGVAVGTPETSAYLARHDHARRWAAANRELIALRMLDRLKTAGSRVIDTCHNWVESREVGGRACWIHRKGAAPSTEGPVIIPGSRGARTYVVLPTDPREHSAFSLAHGAGRKWARSDTRARLEKRFKAKDLSRTELGSYVICEDKQLLYEEAPQAYKNITTVIDDLVREDLAEVVAVLKPLVTYKVRRC
jgi:release factor H-coupled RctB family protein